jgi:mono/diheme cytochrome c family protein
MKTYAVAALLAIAITAAGQVGRAQAAAPREGPNPAEKRQLYRQGAKLWPVYCGRCHQDRPGAEFSPDQWGPIMMHMRSVSEMPASDARALTEYLKSGR